MFFKVLAAFSLGALALNVNAAPPAFFSSLEIPMLSCSANGNFAPFAVPVNSLGEIEPGEYALYNEAFGGNPLRSYKLNQPIFLSRTRENPAEFGMWEIEPLDSNEYMITNIGLGAGAYATSKGQIVIKSLPGLPDTFAIEPAGEYTFTIKVPNEDLVWAVDPRLFKASVYLKPQDGYATRWMLLKLEH